MNSVDYFSPDTSSCIDGKGTASATHAEKIEELLSKYGLRGHAAIITCEFCREQAFLVGQEIKATPFSAGRVRCLKTNAGSGAQNRAVCRRINGHF